MNSPSHQQKLAFIREKCIEANPEIVELKFGCQVSVPYFVQEHQIRLIGSNPMVFPDGKVAIMDQGSYVGNEACKHFFKDKAFHTFESGVDIIGRPITLADVLLALQAVEDGGLKYGINAYGAFKVNWLKENVYTEETRGRVKGCVCWDFKKTLEDQDETTISFIYDVLK